MRINKILALAVFLAAGLVFPQARCFAQMPEHVRVQIIRDAESLSLKIKGDYSIKDPVSGKYIYQNKDLYATVTAAGAKILMGEQAFDKERLLIVPAQEDAVTIDGRRFRGNILLILRRPPNNVSEDAGRSASTLSESRTEGRGSSNGLMKSKSGVLSVINYIDLEDYVQGVLYHETSHYWPDEVLKAQAIICRTYALYQMKQNQQKDFDVTRDIYSQVYGGRTSERYRLNRAVRSTAGAILNYQGELLPSFYHASCGGYTEDAYLVWKVDLAPLKGVLCPFCKDSPHYNWHCVLSLEEILEKLKNSGFNIDEIKGIGILGRDGSGRITDLAIASVKNDTADIKIAAKDFRNVVGPNVIMSTNFTVAITGGDAVFEGLGWGHGVGFCQWGGYFMAKRGDSCEQILKYYYPGVDISGGVTSSK
ncbi:MAG: SpoIID/LytB domain-containing protein [Candidatus Omnitrophota bacterium]|nr:SpoIID/LytB domain-containing protein [Candidatus Omnitrophota bacterium]